MTRLSKLTFSMLLLICQMTFAQDDDWGSDNENSKYKIFTEKDKKGIKDQNNNVVVKANYDEIGDQFTIDLFENGFEKVKQNNAFGLINSEGKEIILPEYSTLEVHQENQYILVEKEEKWGILAMDGKIVVPLKYDDIEFFNPLHTKMLIPVKVENLWGAITLENKMVFQPQFETMGPFYETGVSIVEKDKKIGYINYKGEVIAPCKYDEGYTLSGYRTAVSQNNLWTVIDITGKELFPMEYSFIRVIEDTDIVFANKGGKFKRTYDKDTAEGGKWAIMKNDGTMITDFEFDEISTWPRGVIEGILPLKMKNKWGLISLEGEMIADFQYDDLAGFSRVSGHNYLFNMIKDGKKVFVNIEGKEVILD